MAFVRYEVEVAQGFETFEHPGMGSSCHTPPFEWVINKRLDAAGNPTAIERVLLMGWGALDGNGHCILRSGAWGWVPPSQFRVVATDYDWIAKCDATLIALETSGSFQNVRFVKGSGGCEVTIQELPSP